MQNLSEQRARQVAKDLLKFRKWRIEPVFKNGQCLEENEYRNYPHLSEILKGKSKTGKGDGYPDFLIVNSATGQKPLLIIETKAISNQINTAISEATHYGDACGEYNHDVVCVGIAGGEKELFSISVKRKIKDNWTSLTLNNEPIDWIPSQEQIEKLLTSKTQTEVQPEKPSAEILNDQANRINEILRECKIKDEFRPAYIATIMLALWKGDVSVSPNVVLTQINANAKQALIDAGKSVLQDSLRVDAQNTILAAKAWQIIDILKKLNIQSFIREHDYLGQLYETFFRYTGGNTIGQYFTPRHIIEFICELLDISPSDKVFDPACGTGGFLIGALNSMVKKSKKPYQEAVDIVKENLFGLESEPATAALCVTNMILRGDGKSGIEKGNCFELDKFPYQLVDFVLMNPPFPHKKKTDTPTTDFLDRALLSIKTRGILAAIVPYSLLVNMSSWHKKLLKENTLHFIATLTQDAFEPYAAYNTAILMIQKGVPHGNKRVFMARIFNDGYKIKKGTRVEREGSQLNAIADAFEGKRAIPELTAFPIINVDSLEWSPENYIENAVHSDSDFIDDFEQHMRKHASFYMHYGHKLINDKVDMNKVVGDFGELFVDTSKIDLKGIKMAPIFIQKYFDVKLGGHDEIEDLEDGDCPMVSTSEFMNGVKQWKAANTFYPFPTITVATDGSVCSSFVQEYPYYAFYKVAIVEPKKKIPIDALYFISYLLYREKWRYVYARKFGKARILNTELLMPVLNNGEPDFEKMAEITRLTKAYPIITMFRIAIKKTRTKAENKPVKGLSDSELIAKYESGEMDSGKTLIPIMKKRLN